MPFQDVKEVVTYLNVYVKNLVPQILIEFSQA
jgi:hypothetical protein